MKLRVELRLCWENSPITLFEIEGFYTNVWIDADIELISKRNYRIYCAEGEDFSNEDLATLRAYYWLYGEGSLPANCHPALGLYGLPTQVELRDFEWVEEDE